MFTNHRVFTTRFPFVAKNICIRATGLHFSEIALLCGVAAADQPVSSCQDLDTSGCAVFAKAKPDLCQDPMFAQSTCKRYCGNCPLECYNCPSSVLHPDDCNTTSVCGQDQGTHSIGPVLRESASIPACMTKHLSAVDGHHEYIMTCETKQTCGGLSFGFGKRHINDVGEIDVVERDRFERNVFIDCCDTDFCNMPTTTTTSTTTTTTKPPTTTTRRPTTRHPTTHKPVHQTTHHATPGACHRDIVIVVDDSGSVGSTNFNHIKDFVSQIVSKIHVGKNGAHIAMVAFSSNPQVEWPLNKYFTQQQLIQAIHHVPYISGGTRTDLAIDKVMNTILTHSDGDRVGADNAVLVITDGRSNQPQATIHEANKLQHVSHDIVTLGVGHGFDMNELKAIATDRHHVFSSASFQNLGSLTSRIVNLLCN